MPRGLGPVALATLASLAACDQLFDIQEREGLPADSGEASTASADSSETSTSGTPTCAGPTIYVSTTTGSDSNPGCSSSAPKQTIGAALAAAAASAAGTVTSIEVCRGDYIESELELTTATSLLGGYSCGAWKRTAMYGYPSFDGVSETTIENNRPDKGNGATLAIEGGAITSSVVIDGFTILGATSGTPAQTVSAVSVGGQAAPTVSNNKLAGGSLTVANLIASVGVYVTDGANPTITNNSINGGSGTIASTSNETNHASIGVFGEETSAGAQILDNAINGGGGKASNMLADGSVAVDLLGPAADAGAGPTYKLHGNSLIAGTGTSVVGTSTSGLFASGVMTLVVDSNSIDGGGSTAGGRCSMGVYSQVTGQASFTANRIYGGDCGISPSGGSASPAGLRVFGGSSPIIYNNMIHGGTATNAPVVGSSALHLYGGVTDADVRHNTLIAGPSNGSTPQALWLEAATGTTIVNNILAGTGTDVGLLVSQCIGTALTTFENNLIFGTTAGLLAWSGCNGNASLATVAAMTKSLLAAESGATVQGNVTLQPTCGTTDPACIASAACSSPPACLMTLFGGWDAGSTGYKNLFPASGPFAGACPGGTAPPAGNGWTIAASPKPPCSVTRSGVDDTALPGLNVDLYGNCRSSAPSMGADEDSQQGACQ